MLDEDVMNIELNDENIFIYAAKWYYNPLGVDAEEFYEDLKRPKFIKRLIYRYKNGGDLSERLILNHLITIFNVFGVQGGLKILNFHLTTDCNSVIKPFLIFLKAIRNDEMVGVQMDRIAIEKLRKIKYDFI